MDRLPADRRPAGAGRGVAVHPLPVQLRQGPAGRTDAPPPRSGRRSCRRSSTRSRTTRRSRSSAPTRRRRSRSASRSASRSRLHRRRLPGPAAARTGSSSSTRTTRPAYPIMAKAIPGTDQLLVISENRPYADHRRCRASRTTRRRRRPTPSSCSTRPRSGTAYDICFHPKFAENDYLYVGWNGDLDGGKRKKKACRVTRYTMNDEPAADHRREVRDDDHRVGVGRPQRGGRLLRHRRHAVRHQRRRHLRLRHQRDGPADRHAAGQGAAHRRRSPGRRQGRTRCRRTTRSSATSGSPRRRGPTACATRGGSPATRRPATSGSARTARTCGSRRTSSARATTTAGASPRGATRSTRTARPGRRRS